MISQLVQDLVEAFFMLTFNRGHARIIRNKVPRAIDVYGEGTGSQAMRDEVRCSVVLCSRDR